MARRIAGGPGSDYGAFSVFMQYYTQPELLFDVPASCFLPAPKVTSSVLRCTVRREPPVAFSCGEAFFFKTVRAAFALRRKTLANSLASVFGGQLTTERLTAVITGCGLRETVRGEQLDLAAFARLADGLFAEISAAENFMEKRESPSEMEASSFRVRGALSVLPAPPV